MEKELTIEDILMWIHRNSDNETAMDKIFYKTTSRRKLRRAFQSMNTRCNNPNYFKYHRYGGRGIKNEWESFEDFFGDMAESYVAHVKEHGVNDTTIDRIDNDGNYCKENCRWATNKIQSRNRSTNNLVHFNDETKLLVEWAEELKIPFSLLSNRLRSGWSTKRAFNEPIGSYYKNTYGKTRLKTNN